MMFYGKSRRLEDWIEAGLATLSKVLNDLNYSCHPENSSNQANIEKMLAWLCRAQDAVNQSGFSAGYFPLGGWSDAYPETTGYIIPTLYDAASALNRNNLRIRATRAVEWLLLIQQPLGAFPEGLYRPNRRTKASVFNTGQVLFGLLRNYLEEGHPAVRRAIECAGSWLVSIQDSDGSWKQFCYRNYPNAYSTRTAWALALSGLFLQRKEFLDSANRQITWASSRKTKGGWIREMAFSDDKRVFLHTLAYTLRGLLETSLITGNRQAFEISRTMVDKLANELLYRGMLYGAYRDCFLKAGSYQCLTGNAQVGVLFGRFYLTTAEKRYLNALKVINGWVRAGITKKSPYLGHRGGVAGSFPFWGRYMTLRFPNWGVKFALDSLLLEEHLSGRLKLPKYSDSLGVPVV